eukprot:3198339-Rhodomonas_salina.2
MGLPLFTQVFPWAQVFPWQKIQCQHHGRFAQEGLPGLPLVRHCSCISLGALRAQFSIPDAHSAHGSWQTLQERKFGDRVDPQRGAMCYASAVHGVSRA